MSSTVKKVFSVLIVVVLCVLIGALVLNVFFPNAVSQISNTIEVQVKNATGLSFDFNGDGSAGGVAQTTVGGTTNIGVGGFNDGAVGSTARG